MDVTNLFSSFSATDQAWERYYLFTSHSPWASLMGMKVVSIHSADRQYSETAMYIGLPSRSLKRAFFTSPFLYVIIKAR